MKIAISIKKTKTMRILSTFLLTIILFTIGRAQTPPYSGTIFIDPDILTSTDPVATPITTYTGQGSVTMYDRRVNNWVTVTAYLFSVVWSDGITSRAQVNPEFGSVAAATVEAQKYASLIGQLPACLRQDVNEIWIHQGIQPFGGGNNSILIHTGQSTLYENDGILEETLVHEACHTSLDATNAGATGWTNAQIADNNFISTYARDNPTREDIAESFLTWLAVRYRRSRISVTTYNNITQTIPNRLNYFDGINCNLSPLPVDLVNFSAVNLKETNILSWQTATESNNDKFEIERSSDAKDFKSIGEVKGKGTSNTLQKYEFTDVKPQNSINYYRLKQVDFDGRIDYSKILSIYNANVKTKLGELYPNPSQFKQVNLDYTTFDDNEIRVSVFDLNGKLVTQQTKSLHKGNNLLSFDFSLLNQGMYVVKIETDKDFSYKKIILE
jgi:hypothetical protein